MESFFTNRNQLQQMAEFRYNINSAYMPRNMKRMQSRFETSAPVKNSKATLSNLAQTGSLVDPDPVKRKAALAAYNQAKDTLRQQGRSYGYRPY